MYVRLFEAAACVALKKTEAAHTIAEACVKNLLEWGFLTPLVEFSTILEGRVETCIHALAPEREGDYFTARKRFTLGWMEINRALRPGGLPTTLTRRKHEVANLAAEGLRNREIAGRLFISEKTVRCHLSSVFQKLQIDRRSSLREKI